MRIILLFLVPPLLIAPVVFALVLVPLPAPFPPLGSRVRTAIAATVMVGSSLAWLGVLGKEVLAAVRGPSLASLFFAPGELRSEEPWILIGHHYQGRFGVRDGDVFFLPGRAAQRPLLTLEVSARPTLLLSAGMRTPLAAGGTGQPFSVDHAELQGVQLISPEPDRARAFLDDASARALLAELLAAPERFGHREVAVLADRVRVRARPAALDETVARRWMSLAARLAGRIEEAGTRP